MIDERNGSDGGGGGLEDGGGGEERRPRFIPDASVVIPKGRRFTRVACTSCGHEITRYCSFFALPAPPPAGAFRVTVLPGVCPYCHVPMQEEFVIARPAGPIVP